MAEEKGPEKYIEFDAVNHMGKPVTVFSTTGEGRTEQEFHKVMDAYNKSNGYRLPASFTVLPKGEFLQRARSVYEGANQPIQGALAAGGRQVGSQAASAVAGPATYLGEKLGILPEGSVTALINKGEQVGESVGETLGAPFRTPEAAIGTAGGISGALLTKRMGIPSQMAGIGLGTLAGLQGGRMAFGGQQSFENFGLDFAEASLAAATRGAFGVVQNIIQKSPSQLAKTGMAKDLGALLRGELAPLADDPAVLIAHFETPAGLAQLTQMGTKYFRQDVNQLSNQVIRAINARAPNTLDRSTASTIRKLSEDLFEQGNVYLDALGDRGKMNAASSMMAKTHESMREILRQKFSADPQKKALAATITSIDDAMQQHKRYLDQFTPSGEVLGAIKRSANKDGGFDPKGFQDEIKGLYQQYPGSLMEAAGRIAQRGGQPLTEGVDRKLFSGNIPIPKPSVIPGGPWKLPLGPLGQHYTGTVQSPTAAILSAVAGRAAAEKSGIRGNGP